MSKRWTEYAPEIGGEIDETYRRIEDCKSSILRHGGFKLTGYISGEDARLMAAAPELLEALEQCLQLIESYERLAGYEFPIGNVARSAIKKARGENGTE